MFLQYFSTMENKSPSFLPSWKKIGRTSSILLKMKILRYFCTHNFLYPEFWTFIINYPGNGFNTVKKVFCFITQFLFLWNMNKTVFIVVRKIVGMILHKWRISGLSQSVSCPFADKQAFSVQFRSMDRGEKMCLGDRF